MYFCNVKTLIDTLLKGGSILYPTDTIWGLGCDATNPSAIEKLYQIKERDHSKSMLILIADEQMLLRYFPHPSPEAIRLLLESERPTTVILPASESSLPSNLLAQDGTIGVRIPKHQFCQDLLNLLGRPVVSTSANLSGHPSPTGFQDIEEELKSRVDAIAHNIDTQPALPSRIVKITDAGEVLIIRS